MKELSATPGVHINTKKNVNNLTQGSYSFHDFSHHLYKFFMTLGLAATFENFLNISCFKLDFFDPQSATNFLWVLIFGIFPAIRKNKVPQIKITAKIYSSVNILYLKFTTQKYSTKKSCLLNYNLSLSFRNEAVYNEILTHTVVLFQNMYFFCTFSMKKKILSMLGTGHFLKIAKINSQQEKPICPNCKN